MNSKGNESRKGRKFNPNNGGELYECPCGRIYTSYPALYSHIKQIHQGKAPGLIKMPLTTRKRIGTSKIQNHNKIQLIQVSKYQPKSLNDIFKPLLIQIQTLPSHTIGLIQQSQSYKLIIKYDSQAIPIFNEIDSIYDLKVCQGVSVLFKQLFPILSQDVFNSVRLAMIMLLDYMVEDSQDQNIIIQGSFGLIIDYANYFIVTNLAKKIYQLKIQNTWISQKKNIMIVFHVIFQWMLYKRYTLTTVEFNTKYNENEDYKYASIRESIKKNQSNDSDSEDLNQKNKKKKKVLKKLKHLKKESSLSQSEELNEDSMNQK